MHKYNHPPIKANKYFQPFQWLVEKHANSGNFNVLKTISRLIGLIAYGLITLISKFSGFNGLAFVTTIILIDSAFLFSSLKESSFKSSKFFKENKCTRQSLDRYITTMSSVKLVMLIIFSMYFIGFFEFSDLMRTIFGGFFMVIYFPGPWIVAYFVNYKPYIPDGSVPDNKPWYYGIPGFGMAGNYTGEPGSIGGQSG